MPKRGDDRRPVTSAFTGRSSEDRALRGEHEQLFDHSSTAGSRKSFDVSLVELPAERLAHEAPLAVSAYLRIEAPLWAPGWSTVRRIAEALDVSLKELAEAVEAKGE
jgi:hypothetical protein